MTAKDEALELAREGVEMHAPHAPEYKVCAALIEALAQRDALLLALRPFADIDLRTQGVHHHFVSDVLFARAAIAKISNAEGEQA